MKIILIILPETPTINILSLFLNLTKKQTYREWLQTTNLKHLLNDYRHSILSENLDPLSAYELLEGEILHNLLDFNNKDFIKYSNGLQNIAIYEYFLNFVKNFTSFDSIHYYSLDNIDEHRLFGRTLNLINFSGALNSSRFRSDLFQYVNSGTIEPEISYFALKAVPEDEDYTINLTNIDSLDYSDCIAIREFPKRDEDTTLQDSLRHVVTINDGNTITDFDRSYVGLQFPNSYPTTYTDVDDIVSSPITSYFKECVLVINENDQLSADRFVDINNYNLNRYTIHCHLNNHDLNTIYNVLNPKSTDGTALPKLKLAEIGIFYTTTNTELKYPKTPPRPDNRKSLSYIPLSTPVKYNEITNPIVVIRSEIDLTSSQLDILNDITNANRSLTIKVTMFN